MAIEAVYLTLLTKAVQLLRQRTGDNRRLTALALGYPDLLVPEANLMQILGPQIMQNLPQRADAAQIWRWHGLQGATDPLYDSLAVLDRLGLDVTVIDIVAARGNERIVDLNEPLPDDLRNRFDIVIDTGTCEHCFNVGVAFRNACEAVGQNGFLIHAAPLNRYNHGFWSFNPTIYPDYFGDNGFRLHYISGIECNLAEGFSAFPVEMTRRFGKAQDNAALYVLAERLEIRPQVWPVQHKYRT
ncbi:hypothetical protein [Ferrovibrio xuzhouensis]|uniref:Methyltransferase family protein n=1 Tax=Ferrovibrio xuzhouensis TaxID=1576914 RepID=A0ABV7VJX1_9PROT